MLNPEACAAFLDGQPDCTSHQQINAVLGLQRIELGRAVIRFGIDHGGGATDGWAKSARAWKIIPDTPARVVDRRGTGQVLFWIDRIHVVSAGGARDVMEFAAGEPFPEKARASGILAGTLAVDPYADVGLGHALEEACEEFEVDAFVFEREGQVR